MALYAKIGIILMLLYFGLMRLSFIAGIHKKGRHAFVAFLYVVGFLYIVGQGVFYANALPDSSPDEVAHISYIYHVNTTGEIIPHFEEMHLFSSQPMKWSIDNYQYNQELINYLCHPSIYYQVMRLAGGFNEVEPGVVIQIDKMRLRYFSLGIAALGIALLLYIGWSRIDRNKPWLHLLYITAATCIPIMCLEMCAVTNDSLAILTTCMCGLGLIRFCEDKRNLGTYLLITGGITLSFMNKMTTAMLCVLMSLIVLVVTCIKEKGIAGALKKEFWFTAPLLILPLIYIVIIYHRYGVLQPTLKVISPEEYFETSFFYVAESERSSAGFGSYLATYLNNFAISWSGLVTDDMSLRKSSPWTVSTLPMELLWFTPLFAFAKDFKKAANKITLPILAGWISTVLTFLLQFKKAYGNFVNNGYTGGSQARYYVPMIFIFALATVFIFDGLIKENGFDRQTETTTITDLKAFRRRTIYNQIVYILGLCYGLVLFYGNLPFFLLHN